MIVRKAKPEDLEAAVRFTADLCKDPYSNGQRMGPFEEVGARDFLRSMLSADHILAFVSEHDDRLTGMVIGALMPCWTSWNTLSLEEVFWWVDPDHRGKGTGAALLDVFEKEAKASGASRVVMRSSIPSKITKVYQRRGYEPLHTSWAKEL